MPAFTNDSAGEGRIVAERRAIFLPLQSWQNRRIPATSFKRHRDRRCIYQNRQLIRDPTRIVLSVPDGVMNRAGSAGSSSR